MLYEHHSHLTVVACPAPVGIPAPEDLQSEQAFCVALHLISQLKPIDWL